MCSVFSGLRENETLRLIYDYEPRQLRRRFESTFTLQFVWMQRRLAREHWEISLRKVEAPSDEASTTHFMHRCPIFANAKESTLKLLGSAGEVKVVRRKTTIAEQESLWPFLGVVRKGRNSAIIGHPLGRDQILFEALETEVFGNIILFDGGATIARFATLADPAEILLFPRAAVLEVAEADSRFALALAAAAAQQVRTIADTPARPCFEKNHRPGCSCTSSVCGGRDRAGDG